MRKPLIAGLILLGFLILVGAAGAWIVFGPNTPDFEDTRDVKIPRGSGFEAVLDSLETNGILASRRTLRWVGQTTGWADQMKAGYYRFESGASNYNLLDKIRKGQQDPVRVVIPPGSRPEVISAVASREMAFPADTFRAALRNTALARALDTDTTHLFGYLLPETYSFYWLTDADEVIRRVKQHFDNFYDDQMAARADSLGLSKDEVVTLASIIEWETGLEDEKERVAGVYLNRQQVGMPLQADPTVQYAVLQEEGQKRRLLYEDYDIEHPYNTYRFQGLPPGPITNPSLSSIQAVLNPEEHNYFYFVAHPDGGHTFSETLREHNRAAREYHDVMRQRRAAQEEDSEQP